jgi:hypothetical protein
MNNKVLKITSALSVHAPMIFNLFCVLIVKKNTVSIKFMAASMKTLEKSVYLKGVN